VTTVGGAAAASAGEPLTRSDALASTATPATNTTATLAIRLMRVSAEP
jgi:hypothetical protein